MCYDMLAQVRRTEYVCSKCGKKILHIKGGKLEKAKDEEYHRWGLSEVRELKLDATLKRRGICETCAKDAGLAAETFGFYVDITLNDTTTRTLLQADDWEKLIAFLKGEDTWEKEHSFISTEWVTGEDGGDIKREEEGEYPLKPEIPRICALLGIDEKSIPKIEPLPARERKEREVKEADKAYIDIEIEDIP